MLVNKIFIDRRQLESTSNINYVYKMSHVFVNGSSVIKQIYHSGIDEHRHYDYDPFVVDIAEDYIHDEQVKYSDEYVFFPKPLYVLAVVTKTEYGLRARIVNTDELPNIVCCHNGKLENIAS